MNKTRVQESAAKTQRKKLKSSTKKYYLAFGDRSALQFEYKIASKLELEDKLEVECMLAASYYIKRHQTMSSDKLPTRRRRENMNFYKVD